MVVCLLGFSGSTVLQRPPYHALRGQSCRGEVKLDKAASAPLQGKALLRRVDLRRDASGLDEHDFVLQVQAGRRGGAGLVCCMCLVRSVGVVFGRGSG